MVEIGQINGWREHRQRRWCGPGFARIQNHLVSSRKELKPATRTTVSIAVWYRIAMVQMMMALSVHQMELFRKARGAN